MRGTRPLVQKAVRRSTHTIVLMWPGATVCYMLALCYEAGFTGRLVMYEAWGFSGA